MNVINLVEKNICNIIHLKVETLILQMKCCGVDTWKDWGERNPNYETYNNIPDPLFRPDYPTDSVPGSCCDPNKVQVSKTTAENLRIAPKLRIISKQYFFQTMS